MEYKRESDDDVNGTGNKDSTTENQVKIKEEMESCDLNLYMKNNDYTIYENFKIKNEEIDLKFECHDIDDAEQLTSGCENKYVKEISNGDSDMTSDTEEKKPKVNSLEINDLEEVKKLTNHSSKMLNPNHKTTKNNLVVRHIKSHNNIKKFKCIYCSKMMTSQRSLDNHLFTIHKDRNITKKIYECDKCTYETLLKSHLLEHKKTHGLTHGFQFVKCNQCTYKTLRPNYLMKHMETHKNLKKGFKCSYCSKEFRHKISLDNHLLTVHRYKSNVTGKIHNCDRCDYKTLVKKDLLVHKLKHGIVDDLKILKCHQCSYQTYFKKYLIPHIKLHSNIKDFKCTYCSEEFKRKIILEHHLLKNHKQKDITSKIHACDKCNYECLDKTAMLTHKLQHGITDNFPILKCFQCSYETFRKYCLIAHVKTHQNVKDFKCTYCSKEFVQKKSLKNHLIQIHKFRD